MAECIRLDRDFADTCYLAMRAMSRESQFVGDICYLCAEICDACGRECIKHPMDHCQDCAEQCERCAEECRAMSGAEA